jgi:hypothetical protein
MPGKLESLRFANLGFSGCDCQLLLLEFNNLEMHRICNGHAE